MGGKWKAPGRSDEGLTPVPGHGEMTLKAMAGAFQASLWASLVGCSAGQPHCWHVWGVPAQGHQAGRCLWQMAAVGSWCLKQFSSFYYMY